LRDEDIRVVRGLIEEALRTLVDREHADGSTADRELSQVLDAIAGHEAPLAEWTVCATAARSEEARRRQPRAQTDWARIVAVLGRLAASLADDAELHRTFLAHPSVQAVRRRAARRTA
jgi:hypothetical protein